MRFPTILLTGLILPLTLFAGECKIIAIAGGTGSGKTTVANNIKKAIGEDLVIISQDSYYKDLSALVPEERKNKNFDEPDSIDFQLLVSQLKDLKAEKSIEQPIYDFETHTRRKDSITIEPKPVILLEGILLLAIPEVRDLCDLKVFVDTADDIRFIRRLCRDIAERGRTLEGVIEQYQATVRPMHIKYVEPSKKYADLVIPDGGENKMAVGCVIAKICEMMLD